MITFEESVKIFEETGAFFDRARVETIKIYHFWSSMSKKAPIYSEILTDFGVE